MSDPHVPVAQMKYTRDTNGQKSVPTDHKMTGPNIETRTKLHNTDKYQYLRNIASHITHSNPNLLYDVDTLTQSQPRFQPILINSSTSLSTGPAGYFYTPLSACSMGFESLHDDHGVRPRFANRGVWTIRWRREGGVRDKVVASVKRKAGRARAWVGKLVGRG
jgi:hypothetical protein